MKLFLLRLLNLVKYFMVFFLLKFYNTFCTFFIFIYKGPIEVLGFFSGGHRDTFFSGFFKREAYSPFSLFIMLSKGLYEFMGLLQWFGNTIFVIDPIFPIKDNSVELKMNSYFRRLSEKRVLSWHQLFFKRFYLIRFLTFLFVFEIFIFFVFYFDYFFFVFCFYFVLPFFYFFVFLYFSLYLRLFRVFLKSFFFKPKSFYNIPFLLGTLNDSIFSFSESKFLVLKENILKLYKFVYLSLKNEKKNEEFGQKDQILNLTLVDKPTINFKKSISGDASFNLKKCVFSFWNFLSGFNEKFTVTRKEYHSFTKFYIKTSVLSSQYRSFNFFNFIEFCFLNFKTVFFLFLKKIIVLNNLRFLLLFSSDANLKKCACFLLKKDCVPFIFFFFLALKLKFLFLFFLFYFIFFVMNLFFTYCLLNLNFLKDNLFLLNNLNFLLFFQYFYVKNNFIGNRFLFDFPLIDSTFLNCSYNNYYFPLYARLVQLELKIFFLEEYYHSLQVEQESLFRDKHIKAFSLDYHANIFRILDDYFSLFFSQDVHLVNEMTHFVYSIDEKEKKILKSFFTHANSKQVLFHNLTKLLISQFDNNNKIPVSSSLLLKKKSNLPFFVGKDALEQYYYLHYGIKLSK